MFDVDQVIVQADAIDQQHSDCAEKDQHTHISPLESSCFNPSRLNCAMGAKFMLA